MDENGFIYVGIMMGGRAVILDQDGIPVANILAPGFEEGKLRYTPNLVLKQDACEGYLLGMTSGPLCCASRPLRQDKGCMRSNRRI